MPTSFFIVNLYLFFELLPKSGKQKRQKSNIIKLTCNITV